MPKTTQAICLQIRGSGSKTLADKAMLRADARPRPRGSTKLYSRTTRRHAKTAEDSIRPRRAARRMRVRSLVDAMTPLGTVARSSSPCPPSPRARRRSSPKHGARPQAPASQRPQPARRRQLLRNSRRPRHAPSGDLSSGFRDGAATASASRGESTTAAAATKPRTENAAGEGRIHRDQKHTPGHGRDDGRHGIGRVGRVEGGPLGPRAASAPLARCARGHVATL